jgi:hypothetical protein
VKVKTWNVLASTLFLDSHNKKLDRHRSPYAFRGQGGDFPLTPSVMRLKHDPSQVSRIERRLFGSFKKYAHQTVRPDFSEWDWLALAQHYGLPTRLLDWTYSPFVALSRNQIRIDMTMTKTQESNYGPAPRSVLK